MLLTLDLSSSIGWTCGKAEDMAFASGTQVLPKTAPEDIAGFIQSFDDWLSTALLDVTLCVFESPLFLAKSSITTLRKLYGQAAHLEWRCQQARIECLEVNNMKVKKFFNVAGIRGKAGKQAIVNAVWFSGFCPKTHDEADAIAIRLYTIHERFSEHADALGLRLGGLGVAASMG